MVSVQCFKGIITHISRKAGISVPPINIYEKKKLEARTQYYPKPQLWFTDKIVLLLRKPELEYVVAHEFGHLAQRRPFHDAILIFTLIAFLVISKLFIGLWGLVAVGFSVCLPLAYKKLILDERDADRFAVKLCGTTLIERYFVSIKNGWFSLRREPEIERILKRRRRR